MLLGRRASAPYLLQRHGRRHLRADGPPRDRVGPHGRRLDGRDDRPADGDRPPRAGALAGLDDVDDRQPLDRPARACKAWGAAPRATTPTSREGIVKRAVRTFSVIGSPGFPDETQSMCAQLAGAMYDRSHNPAGIVRQMHAITASGDRTSACAGSIVPTTVIHGSCRPAGPPRRRPRHRRGDPRRPAEDHRRHGPRPAPRRSGRPSSRTIAANAARCAGRRRSRAAPPEDHGLGQPGATNPTRSRQANRRPLKHRAAMNSPKAVLVPARPSI